MLLPHGYTWGCHMALFVNKGDVNKTCWYLFDFWFILTGGRIVNSNFRVWWLCQNGNGRETDKKCSTRLPVFVTLFTVTWADNMMILFYPFIGIQTHFWTIWHMEQINDNSTTWIYVFNFKHNCYKLKEINIKRFISMTNSCYNEFVTDVFIIKIKHSSAGTNNTCILLSPINNNGW